jgi:hypothetical protein
MDICHNISLALKIREKEMDGIRGKHGATRNEYIILDSAGSE